PFTSCYQLEHRKGWPCPSWRIAARCRGRSDHSIAGPERCDLLAKDAREGVVEYAPRSDKDAVPKHYGIHGYLKGPVPSVTQSVDMNTPVWLVRGHRVITVTHRRVVHEGGDVADVCRHDAGRGGSERAHVQI